MTVTGWKGVSKVNWMNMLVVVWRAKSPVDSTCGTVRLAVEPKEAEIEPPMISRLVVGVDVEPLMMTDY